MSTLFELGQVVATPGAMEILRTTNTDPLDLLSRHVRGDWGSVSAEDAAENDFSVQEGFRILSSFHVGGATVWILTEADRSVSTLLLGSEY